MTEYDRTNPEHVFRRWLVRGRSAPKLTSTRHRDDLLSAFQHGWADKLDGRGDFVRRTYPNGTGEQLAYMTGRLLAPRARDTRGAA